MVVITGMKEEWLSDAAHRAANRHFHACGEIVGRASFGLDEIGNGGQVEPGLHGQPVTRV